jgi:hypothetical protein
MNDGRYKAPSEFVSLFIYPCVRMEGGVAVYKWSADRGIAAAGRGKGVVSRKPLSLAWAARAARAARAAHGFILFYLC